MWDLDNSTDYAAQSTWIRDKEGAHHWLIAVRGTFDITPDGDLVVARDQPPPAREPKYRGDPSTSSLLLDSDLLAIKPGTDVILDAIAYAPGGRPTERVEASLHVAGLSKTVVVHGPRVYRRGLTGGLATSSSVSFVTHPIEYEWAFGGSDLKNDDPRRQRIDLRNPVGKGVAADQTGLHGQPAHVIEYPNRSITAGPAGFGPIASAWSPRRERAGTYGSHWEETRKPLLPEDYDPAVAFSAPDDQRLSERIRGGEEVVIRNMTPDGMLRFHLPEIYLVFRTYVGTRAFLHEGTLATIFIVPHARTISMIWQGSLFVPTLEMENVDFTFIAEEA